VAEVKPLRLRRERAQPKRAISERSPFAKVLVDHGVYHLGSVFDYSVPATFDEAIVPGTLVEVPFGKSNLQGIVMERTESISISGSVKSISKVLSKLPFVTTAQLELVNTCAGIYGCKEWDFIKSAVPAFSVTGEKVFLAKAESHLKNPPSNYSLPADLSTYLTSKSKLGAFVQLPYGKPYWSIIANMISARATVNKILVVVPNEREQSLIADSLIELGLDPISLRSQDSKSARYSNFLAARSEEAVVIIGTRSATFTDLGLDGTIFIFEDQDESHYERRSPDWNSRAIANIRSKNLSVIYVSAAPSLETTVGISNKELRHYIYPSDSAFGFVTEEEGGNDFFPIVSKGLISGSVLINIGTTGYVNSFACQKCRNIAMCECGGKLTFKKGATSPVCALCARVVVDWRCKWCAGSTPRIVGSGVLRKADELGRSFPGFPVVVSHGGSTIPHLPIGKNLVISTYGVEPRGIYSAIIFLDLEQQLARADLRGAETVRENVFRNLTMLSKNGRAYISLPSKHPFSQDVLRQNPFHSAEREIDERNAAHLPPNFSAMLVTGTDLNSALSVLSEIPGLEIVGPYARDNLKAIILKSEIGQRQVVLDRLVAINRVNSLRNIPLFSVKLDPFTLF